ncbi:MAG: hypothetical protein AB7F39_06515 [Variibacter sp.]
MTLRHFAALICFSLATGFLLFASVVAFKAWQLGNAGVLAGGFLFVLLAFGAAALGGWLRDW